MNIQYKLKKIKKPELLLFMGMFLYLFIKYIFITNLTSSVNGLLSTYKFTYTDSFDWFANGLRMFHNDSLSMRNPGLPIIINILNHLHVIYLLPLINQLAFLTLTIAIYYSLKQLTKNIKYSMFIALVVLMNYSLNIQVNFLMADIYAVAAIAVAIYLLITKKFLASFLFIGTSMLFQNFAYFLYLFWVVYYLSLHLKVVKAALNPARISQNLKTKICILIPLVLPGLMVLPWHIYKFVKFGNPFYTKVEQFGLVSPSLHNLPYYLYRSYLLWGPQLIIFLLVLAYSVFAKRTFFKNKLNAFLLIVFGFSVVFWIILYNFPDRRFLIYIVPWLYILGGSLIYLYRGKFKLTLVYTVALIILYFATLPIISTPHRNNIPLAYNYYIVSNPGHRLRKFKISHDANFRNPIMNISPLLYDSIKNTGYYTNLQQGKYFEATKYLSDNYDSSKNCLKGRTPLSHYVINSVAIINYSIDVSQLNYQCPMY